ncbi:V-type ATPase [Mycena olivaceomarginata]|nr:V-type ATPase [Mycena olivaceomarginata]
MSVCPPYAPFFGFAGVSAAVTVGAAFGTAKAGIWPELIMKSLIPVVMSGIIAVYGLVVSVLIVGSLQPNNYSLYAGFVHLGAGLACGGYAIGLVGDACVRAYVNEQKVFVGMVLMLILERSLDCMGALIVALIMNTKATTVDVCG